jgi:hypothetical protein
MWTLEDRGVVLRMTQALGWFSRTVGVSTATVDMNHFVLYMTWAGTFRAVSKGVVGTEYT